MLQYAVRRVVSMAPLLVVITALTFLLGQYGAGDLAAYLTMQTTGMQTFEREMIIANPRHFDEATGDLKSDARGVYRARPHVFYDGALSPNAQDAWETSPGRKALEGASTAASEGTVAGRRVLAIGEARSDIRQGRTLPVPVQPVQA